MSLKAEDYKPGDPIFTWVDATTGENVNIDSEKLRQWCLDNKDKLEVVNTPVNPRIAATFIRDNVVDPLHLIRLMEMEHLDPIIYCATGTFTNGGPDVIMADGHHRYYLAYKLLMKWIPAYVLTPEQWRPFQIEGLPPVTEEQLKLMPTKPRGGK